MWGSGPCMAPMWRFWWIFPAIGLLIFLFFVISVMRMIAGGVISCAWGAQDSRETYQLRREIEDLRERLRKQEAAGEQ